MLLAMGPIYGGQDATVGRLRTCVRPGGMIVLDDAFIADGATVEPDELEHCHDRATTRALLQAHGDRILVEQTIDGPETRSYYEGVHALVERRARQLAARHPHLANVFEEYIERQRHEIKLLTGPVVGALWVLEEGPIRYLKNARGGALEGSLQYSGVRDRR